MCGYLWIWLMDASTSWHVIAYRCGEQTSRRTGYANNMNMRVVKQNTQYSFVNIINIFNENIDLMKSTNGCVISHSPEFHYIEHHPFTTSALRCAFTTIVPPACCVHAYVFLCVQLVVSEQRCGASVLIPIARRCRRLCSCAQDLLHIRIRMCVCVCLYVSVSSVFVYALAGPTMRAIRADDTMRLGTHVLLHPPTHTHTHFRTKHSAFFQTKRHPPHKPSTPPFTHPLTLT